MTPVLNAKGLAAAAGKPPAITGGHRVAIPLLALVLVVLAPSTSLAADPLTDTDGDGIPDVIEMGPGGEENPRDTDGDGIPDHLDLDSDGDTILDADEVGPLTLHPVDTDGDGVPDYLDLDSDGDGIPDFDEAGDDDPSTPPIDSDGDGVPDYRDIDSNDDGVRDGVELSGGGCATGGTSVAAMLALLLAFSRRLSCVVRRSPLAARR